jgi:hypothetical protein
MATPNPFLADPAPNPFMDLKPAQLPAAALPPCGDPTCKRSHRGVHSELPEHYSSDSIIRAKQMNEDGKMGGAKYGALGGARKTQKRRATEIVAESAAEHAEAIKQVFIDGIDDTNPIGVRLQAAKEFLKVEQDDIERDLAERKAEFDAMNKEQLVGNITEMLAKLSAAGQIAAEVDAIVDADVVD